MKKKSIRMVAATEAKNRFGDLIKSVYLRREHLIVSKDGIPVIAIVPIIDYAQLVADQELPQDLEVELTAATERERAHERLTGLLAEVHSHMPDVSEEEAEQDILEAIRAVRSARVKTND